MPEEAIPLTSIRVFKDVVYGIGASDIIVTLDARTGKQLAEPSGLPAIPRFVIASGYTIYVDPADSKYHRIQI